MSLEDVIEQIHKEYRLGEIRQCKLDGETVFVGTHNHADASSEVFDDQGNVIMFCNWAWGGNDIPDDCFDMEGCETIYRVEGFISGDPAVDIYGLGD